jgi:hypothetical protein
VNIAEMGFEKGVVHTLELVLEDLSALRSNLQTLVNLTDQNIDTMHQFIAIGDSMKQSIEQLRRNQQGDEDGKSGS